MSMRFSSRFSLVVLVFCGGFVAAWLIGARWQGQELEELADRGREDHGRTLDRWIEAIGRPLDQFASDYAYWSEMVAFVENPDPTFRAQNIDYLVDERPEMDGVWVFTEQWSLVASRLRDQGGGESVDPLAPWVPVLDSLPAGPMTRHRFFLDDRGTPLQVVVYPIQHNDQPRSVTPPRGWLALGQRWDRGVIDDIQKVVGGKVSIHPTAAARASQGDQPNPRILQRVFRDPVLHAAFVLEVELDAAAISAFERFMRRQAVVVIAFVSALFVGLSTYVYFMLVRPVNSIAAHLRQEGGGQAPRLGFARSPELETLVESAEEFLGQKQRLAEEVERRRQAEISLRFRERDLAVLLDQREALARDLHDGSIQSLYALGLHLESMDRRRSKGLGTPEEDSAGLKVVRTGINRVIADLRDFISGSGPSSLRGVGLAEAIEDLVEQNREASNVGIEAFVDPGISARLGSALTNHLFFIIHELVSNALRHGRPSRVEIRLEPASGEADAARLRVANDGTPFVPPLPHASGGWRNLRARADEISARLQGREEGGWMVIELEFPLPPDERLDE